MLNTLKILCILLKVLILTTVVASDTSLKDLKDGILPRRPLRHTSVSRASGSKRSHTPNAPGIPILKKFNLSYWILEWEPPQSQTLQVTLYRLEGYIVKNDYKQSNQTDEQWHLYYEGKDNYWLIDKKDMNQKYYFRVQAKNIYGFGKWSNSSIVDLTESIETSATPYNLPKLVLIITSFVVTIIIVYYFYCPACRQRNKCNREDNTPSIMTDNLLYSQVEDNPDVSTWQDELDNIELYMIKIKREQITQTKFLGEGAFGEVFQGTVRNLEGSDITPVAIKMLGENVSLKEKTEFLQEAKIMSQFCDQHVLRLLGICIDGESPWLILELMEADLLQYLRESRILQSSDARALRMQDLLAMCENVARGCCYLEKLRFVHRDLACRNCFISTRNRENRIVKIGNFGLARDISRKDYYRMESGGMVPVRWMAPESLVPNGIFTSKTDVWAFGVLMWEIMSLGKQPYSDKSNSEVIQYVRKGGKLSKPDVNCPLALYQLMQRCWDSAHERPTFQSCLENIVTLRDNIEDAMLIVHP